MPQGQLPSPNCGPNLDPEAKSTDFQTRFSPSGYQGRDAPGTTTETVVPRVGKDGSPSPFLLPGTIIPARGRGEYLRCEGANRAK